MKKKATIGILACILLLGGGEHVVARPLPCRAVLKPCPTKPPKPLPLPRTGQAMKGAPAPVPPSRGGGNLLPVPPHR